MRKIIFITLFFVVKSVWGQSSIDDIRFGIIGRIAACLIFEDEKPGSIPINRYFEFVEALTQDDYYINILTEDTRITVLRKNVPILLFAFVKASVHPNFTQQHRLIMERLALMIAWM